MSQPIMAFGFFRMPIHSVVPADKEKNKNKNKIFANDKISGPLQASHYCFFFPWLMIESGLKRYRDVFNFICWRSAWSTGKNSSLLGGQIASQNNCGIPHCWIGIAPKVRHKVAVAFSWNAVKVMRCKIRYIHFKIFH